MIQVSDKYKENINADTELMECRAELSFVPPGADNGAEISSSQEADLSFKDQAANGDFNMAAKWGSLEPGRIVLDGSISFQSSQIRYNMVFGQNKYAEQMEFLRKCRLLNIP